MSLNIDMEKKIKESQGLKRTLVNESLTKKERDVINSVKKMISDIIRSYLSKTRPIAVEAGIETLPSGVLNKEILEELRQIRRSLEK